MDATVAIRRWATSGTRATVLQRGRSAIDTLSVHQWLTVAFTLLAFALRSHGLDARSLWIDEGLTFNRIGQDLAYALSNRIVIDGVTTHDTVPALYFAQLYGFVQGAGATAFTVRLFSVLVSLPSVPLLYILGKRLSNATAGMSAALVGSLAPVYLWYSQEARPYTLLITFSLLSIYALLRVFSVGAPRHERIRWGAAYVISTAAMVYTHYSGLFIVGFEAVYLIVVVAGRRRRSALVWLVGAGLLISPVIPFVLSRMATGAEKDYFFVPLPTILWDLTNGFALGPSVRAEQVWWVDALFVAIAAAGLLSLVRRGKGGWAAWLIGYLGLPLLTLYAASYIKPLYMGVRHLLIISPAYYLAVGIGLSALARWRWPAFLAGLAVIVIGTGYSTANYFNDPVYLKDDHRGLAQYLTTHARPDDAIVVDGAIRAMVFDYYYTGAASVHVVPPFGTPIGPHTLDQLRDLAREHERLWFAYGFPGEGWTHQDGTRPIATWQTEQLTQFGNKYFYGRSDSMSLRGYLTSSPVIGELPVDARRLNVDAGGELTLVGADIVATRVAAGRPLHLTFYWRPKKPLPDYRVSLYLMDDAGRQWGINDAVPYAGFLQPSQWPVDSLVKWYATLMVDPTAPPGRYWLRARVYAPDTGRTLNVMGSDGNPTSQEIDLGSVTVHREQPAGHWTPGEAVQRTTIRWKDGLTLLGYQQPIDTATLGDELALDLYFTTTRPPETNMSLALSLVGQDGGEAASATLPVVSESYPTSQWQPGHVLKGQHRVRPSAAAPSGEYRWCLSLVDAAGTAVSARRGLSPVSVDEVCLGGLTLVEPPVATPPTSVAHTLDATFGDHIQLLGYDLSAATVQPGESFDLTLAWQANAALRTSYKVTLQLLSDDQHIVAQSDGVPANWTRPTTSWRPQEVIGDHHSLTVNADTPPGRYNLIAAVYDEETGDRLPARFAGNRADHVVLTEIVVREK